jgi:hypothetical protein
MRDSLAILSLSTVLGLFFQLALWMSGARWVRQPTFIFAGSLLPPIAATITNAIAGDIALSLGMVGALSIVRFRNPVRSPLELVAYFGLITVGIASTAAFGIAVLLVGLSLALIPTLRLLMRVSAVGGDLTQGLEHDDTRVRGSVVFRGNISLEEISGLGFRSASRSAGVQGARELEVVFEVKDSGAALALVETLRALDPEGSWSILDVG